MTGLMVCSCLAHEPTLGRSLQFKAARHHLGREGSSPPGTTHTAVVGADQYGHAMTRQSWRVDPIGDGSLAWVYVRPHEVDWSVPAAAVAALEYTITEERQNLIDDELGCCLRYLAIRAP